MRRDSLESNYLGYIECLNRQDWGNLGRYVDQDVSHNAVRLGLDGYREMLVQDFKATPDLCFKIGKLVCDPPMLASRLDFDCTPVGVLFGLEVNGKRVRFSEHVFYEFEQGKIRRVWSIIDKAAIADQIAES